MPSVLQAASSPQESFKLWRQEEDIVSRLRMASQFRSALGLRALPRVVIISGKAAHRRVPCRLRETTAATARRRVLLRSPGPIARVED